ncbi:MAG: hypothetical protein V2G33_07775 [bacterium JZ-2024 1]
MPGVFHLLEEIALITNESAPARFEVISSSFPFATFKKTPLRLPYLKGGGILNSKE